MGTIAEIIYNKIQQFRKDNVGDPLAIYLGIREKFELITDNSLMPYISHIEGRSMIYGIPIIVCNTPGIHLSEQTLLDSKFMKW